MIFIHSYCISAERNNAGTMKYDISADPHVVSNKVIGLQRLTMPITIGFVILRI